MIETAELDLIRQNVARFGDGVVRPSLDALNHYPDVALPERLFGTLTEMGLFDLPADGSGALSVALETLSAVAAAPAASVLAHVMGRELLTASGRESLLGVIDGHASRPTFAYPIYAETSGPSPLRVRRAGNEIAIDGTARLVVNAPVARALVLPALEADATPVVLAIEASAAGVRVGEPLLTLGMRGCPTADVAFDGVRVPADRLIAGSSGAAALIDDVARRLRGPVAAICAGILGSSLHAAVAYGRERHQGGRAIVEHQEVRSILARMIEDHVLCRDAAERLSRGVLSEPDALALLVRCKERAAHATCDGVQLLGGYGYMEEYGQERRMRDAKQAQCLLGRTEWLRQRLTSAFIDGWARP